MRKIINKTIIVFLGILFCVITIELGLRTVGFISYYYQEYRNKMAIKKNGTYVVLCFGDSMTFDHYPKYLNEALARRKLNLKFTVIDRGKAGSDSSYVAAVLEKNIDS